MSKNMSLVWHAGDDYNYFDHPPFFSSLFEGLLSIENHISIPVTTQNQTLETRHQSPIYRNTEKWLGDTRGSLRIVIFSCGNRRWFQRTCFSCLRSPDREIRVPDVSSARPSDRESRKSFHNVGEKRLTGSQSALENLMPIRHGHFFESLILLCFDERANLILSNIVVRTEHIHHKNWLKKSSQSAWWFKSFMIHGAIFVSFRVLCYFLFSTKLFFRANFLTQVSQDWDFCSNLPK